MANRFEVITLSNLAGGLNNRFHKALIEDNETPDSQNVWAFNRALTKMPGHFVRGYSSVSAAGIGYDTVGNDGIIQCYSSFADGKSEKLYTIVSLASGLNVSTLSAFSTAGLFMFVSEQATGDKGFTVGIEAAATYANASDKIVLTATSAAQLKQIKVKDVICNGSNTNSYMGQITALTTGSGTTWTASADRTAGFTQTANCYIIPFLATANASPTYSSTVDNTTIQTVEMNNLFFFLLDKNHLPPSTGGYAYAATSTSDTSNTGPDMSCVNVSAWPASRTAVNHKGYIFLGNIGTASAGTTTQIRWSALRDPTTWTTSNTVEVGKQDGQEIIKLISHQGNLVIIKQNSVWLLLGEVFDPSNPTYQLIKLSCPTDFKFSSPDAAYVFNELLYMFTENGVYVYPGGGQVVRSPLHAKVQGTTSLGAAWYPKICNPLNSPWITSSGDTVFFSFSTSTGTKVSNTIVQTPENTLWYMTDSNISRASFTRPVPYKGKTVGVSIQGGSIVTVFDNASAQYTRGSSSTGMNSYWFSKEFNIGYGTFKELVLYYKKQSGTLSIEQKVDQATGITSTANMNIGRGNIVRNVIPINQKGSSFQFAISNSATGENFEVYRADITYMPYYYDREL